MGHADLGMGQTDTHQKYHSWAVGCKCSYAGIGDREYLSRGYESVQAHKCI